MSDTKDWTWVVDRACPDCGFDGPSLEIAQAPELLRATTELWSAVLARADLRRRPAPETWSALEYAAHVRDVHEIFATRLRLMLAEEAPAFPHWDQDAAAVDGNYAAAEPTEVEVALIEAAGDCAGLYAAVTPTQGARTGLRSDGSVFTVATLARYHLHDVVHHLWDVGSR